MAIVNKVWVLKNTKTDEYADGTNGWTRDIKKARRYFGPKTVADHHIQFVEVKE